jgi:hypothetical protein
MVSLFSLALEFTGSQFSAMLSVLFFVNLGGLGWLRLLDPEHGYGDWVHNWGNGRYEYWLHPLMHILVPQRASLWSMPLCYWTILLLIHAVEHRDWRLFLLAGILTGLTPLVQVHSFVALAQWSLTFFLVKFPFKKPNVRYISLWAVFGITANALALPQFAPFRHRLSASRSQFLQFNPIWRTPERGGRSFPALALWWNGLGVFWALSLLGIVALTRRQLAAYVPSLVVYAVTNVVRYQPWELDNTKLFYAAWIPVALPVVSQYLVAVARARVVMLVVAVVLGFAASLSSFIHTVVCLSWRSPIFESHDFAFGHWVAENTATKAVFLTSDWHAHPAATVAGRQLFMGYGGWVESHGLDYWGRSNDYTRMQNGTGNIATFKRYGIEYTISRLGEFGEFERTEGTSWRQIYQDSDYRVWKLTE